MGNPWDRYAQAKSAPWARYSTPATGAAPGTGFAPTGVNPQQHYIPGSEADPSYAAEKTRATANAEQAARIAAEKQIVALHSAADWALYQKEHPDQAVAEVPTSNVHGPAYLQQIPSSMRATVQSLVAGNLSPPTGTALKSPYWQAVIQHAINLDPTYAGQDYSLRQKTRNDFINGEFGKQIAAINTALSHGKNMLDDVKALNNFGGIATPLNVLRNPLESTFGGTAQTNFTNDARKYGSEMAAAYGNGGQDERTDWKGAVGYFSSPDQQINALAHDGKFLKGKIETLQSQYQKGMGPMNSVYDLLDPEARQTLDQLTGVADGKIAPSTIMNPPKGGVALPPGGTGGTPPNSGGTPPNGGGNGGGPLPGSTLATGDTQAKNMDPKTAGLITAMIKNGYTADEMNRILVPSGAIGPQGFKQEDIDKYKKVLDAGGSIMPQYEQPTSLWNKVASSAPGVAVNSAIDSSMGGLEDETAGLVDWARGKGNLSDLIAARNQQKQGAFAANPRAAFWGGVAGNIGGMAGAGLALKGTALAGAASDFLGKATPYAANGLWGGLEGFGQNNDNRIDGAGLGTVSGLAGTLGGQAVAFPVGAAARTGVGQSVIDSAISGTNKVRGMFGRNMIQAPTPAVAPSAADITAGQFINKTGADNIKGVLANAANNNAPFMLADASPEMTSLAGAVVRRSPTASGIASDALNGRNATQIDRLGQSVTNNLGPVQNIPLLSDALATRGKVAAKPLYKAAYAAGQVDDPTINTLLQHPDFQPILADARQLHANDVTLANARGEEPPPPLTQVVGPNGEYTPPDVQTIDYVQRALRAKADAAYSGDSVAKMNAPFLKDARNLILQKTDAAVPEFAAARSAYGGPMQSKDALTMGQQAFNADPGQITLNTTGVSPESLSQQQLGFRSALMDRANSVRDVSNPWETTLGNPNARARIDALYPDNSGNQQLYNGLDLERQMANTRNDVLGNSKTAQRAIADQAFADPGNLPGKAISYGLAAKTGGLSALAHAAVPDALSTAWKLGLGKQAVQRADDLAPILFNPDPNASAQTVDSIMKRLTDYSDYVNATRPLRSLGMFGAGIGNASYAAGSGY